MSHKIIIAGGGTGGHIYPAIAIANALKKEVPDIKILFVGANGKMEMEKVPQEGYEIRGLDIAGLNRSNMLKNLTLPIKLLRSYLQAKEIVEEFNPDICVGVGGYASFPILRVAQKKNIPTLIQEQNSFAGKSNKILSQKAHCICTAYDNMDKFFDSSKILQTGNPVRKQIQEMTVKPEEAYAFFNFNAGKKTLFVFGGSLGAQSINAAMLHHLPELVNSDMQIIWQTGKAFYQQALQASEKYKGLIKVFPFLREMELAYSIADVIVCRSGALSISELCIVGKPVVFVPYPHASEDHQTHNAMALVNKEAAWIIKDDEVMNGLGEKVITLMNDAAKQKVLAENIKKMAVYNADQIIAQKILSLIK